MKTSLIIPFKNEAAYVEMTMRKAYAYLSKRDIDFELVAVDDSTDGTWEILKSFEKSHQNVVAVKGGNPPGYGKALRKGFSVATGDILIPFNGDLSDSLDDVLSYIQLIENGNDMVFGSRFMAGAKITESTAVKGFLSQFGNSFLQWIFRTNCSDITNSFKAYRRLVLKEIKPTADGYNIGMEMALKGIIKKYRYTTIPVAWSGRKYGRSKMSIIKSIPTYLSTALRVRLLGNT
ncbi:MULTISPECIES: glycosyltransferase family 2 protein [unclassified Moorena]|uniref:glycosyltransferase family 2 protein n=1 Tax=unclassified Moorena TaxID=2683338 RepID=UPI0013FE7F41|nr:MULTISPECIES: glycosyltransferase family 2 protein [unclassified Moorena]NEO13851.1 glycosyltransferase family 2 protein [Moorena sp. SIO3E8]NEQ00299.1 glycosyltransferase family 2 protein [Moorena sp. SIO3F7]